MAQRWAIWFAVEGDVRFLSHHEMMRLWERAAARAELPLKFTQGFNPHPKLSFALPRPVGVASRGDLLVAEFTEEAVAESWPQRLQEQLPEGLRLVGVAPLAAGARAQATSATYEMPLAEAEQAALKARLEELKRAEKWEVLRRRPGRPGQIRDIKQGVRQLRVEDGRLRFVLPADGSASAGPADVLRLLGFGDQGARETDPSGLAEATARLIRTKLQCES